jgi:Ni/Fe-hydrogenase subunit HybB-like protein
MLRKPNAELEEGTKGLDRLNLLLVGFLSLVTGYLGFTLLGSSTAASQAINMWLSGSLSTYFWVGFVAIGLAIPILLYSGALALVKRGVTASSAMAALAGVFVLAGGLVLRYIVLGAGTGTNILSVLGFTVQLTVNQTVSIAPTATELTESIGLFAILAVAYAIGGYLLLRTKGGADLAASAPAIVSPAMASPERALAGGDASAPQPSKPD